MTASKTKAQEGFFDSMSRRGNRQATISAKTQLPGHSAQNDEQRTVRQATKRDPSATLRTGPSTRPDSIHQGSLSVTRPEMARQKTARAWRAYLDIMDTAALIEEWMGRQLEGYGVTMREFRLLELLNREGPVQVAEGWKKLGRARTSLRDIASRCQKGGMVRAKLVEQPPVPGERYEQAARRRGVARKGRQARVVGLTEKGKRILAEFLPRHEKWVVATMGALLGREQVTLSRLCGKLRDRYMEKWFYGMRTSMRRR